MKLSQPENWNSLPGPEDILRRELPNGIVVLARPNYDSPSVVIRGYVSGGSLFDPDDRLGLADFVSSMLMRGTAQRSFQQIYDELESVGASLGFGASMHNTNFSGRALAEDLPLLLQSLSECLRQPIFPAEQVEKLRTQLLAGLAIRDQDTGDMASLIFEQLVFNGHPYGRPEDGYSETIRAVTREDLVSFHRRQYGPQGMVVVVVGGVAPEKAADLVADILGDWGNPDKPAAPELPLLRDLEQTIRKHHEIPGKSQTDLVLGTLGPQRSSPDYRALSLGNNVLGQFGMMGRIGDVVREQAGLAYYASTSLNAGIFTGTLEVSAGVNPANVQRAIDLILAELKRFVSEPVLPEELQDSQANFIGRLPLSLESNSGMAAAILKLERYGLGLDYYRHYAARVAAVTPEQVLETAQRYLHPDRLVIVSAGSIQAE